MEESVARGVKKMTSSAPIAHPTWAREHALVSLLRLVPAGDALGDVSIADIAVISLRVKQRGVEAAGHGIALAH